MQSNFSSASPVVIVEDDESIREVLQRCLEMEGYTVYAASNGRDAMELISRISKPRLILLDLMMPEMNGWEFLAAKARHVDLATIPVVVLSAVANRFEIKGKVAAVFDKPLSLDELFAIVERYSADVTAFGSVAA
jgi:CheY-like chemotaxis protein